MSDIQERLAESVRCACARHNDRSVTTSLCPLHAEQDPCLTMARVTGKRRRGSVIRGVCSACNWSAKRTAQNADSSLASLDAYYVHCESGPTCAELNWWAKCDYYVTSSGTRRCRYCLHNEGSNVR